MLEVRLAGGLGLRVDGGRSRRPASRRARAVLAYLALQPRSPAAGPACGALLAGRARRVGARQPAGRADRAAPSARARGGVSGRHAGDGRAGGARTSASTSRAFAAGARRRRSGARARGVRRTDPGRTSTRSGRSRPAMSTHTDSARRSSRLRPPPTIRREAIRLTRAQVALDPLAEAPNRRLIERLAASGDRGAALSAGRQFAERLRSAARASRHRARRARCSTISAATNRTRPAAAGPDSHV